MEANSIGQSGGADPPGQSPEENKSPEEIALLYAAMKVRQILNYVWRSHLLIQAIGRSRNWPRGSFTTRR